MSKQIDVNIEFIKTPFRRRNLEGKIFLVYIVDVSHLANYFIRTALTPQLDSFIFVGCVIMF